MLKQLPYIFQPRQSVQRCRDSDNYHNITDQTKLHQ